MFDRRAYKRKWGKANPDKLREYGRRYRAKNPGRSRYPDRMHRAARKAVKLEEQEGRCALCGGDNPTHFDHCHTTGIERGVLCANCNWGLGHLKHSPQLLHAAAEYIERWHPSTLCSLDQQEGPSWAKK